MFLELSIKNIMHKESILTFITPKFYLLNREDNSLRDYLLTQTNIQLLAICNPFDAVTENVITMLSLEKPKSNTIYAFKYNEQTSRFMNLPPVSIDYCLNYNTHHEIVMGLDEKASSILSKMSTNRILLSQISLSKRGAEVGKTFLREQACGVKSLIGMDMRRFFINWNETYLPIDHKEYQRLSKFFNQQLIYLRRVNPYLAATTSRSEYFAFNKNVYGIAITDARYSLEYILGLINSKAMNFYYLEKFSSKKTETFPEIQTYLYEQLPIPYAQANEQEEIALIVNQILKDKETSISADTSELENELNNYIFNLFNLNQHEVDYINNIMEPILK